VFNEALTRWGALTHIMDGEAWLRNVNFQWICWHIFSNGGEWALN